MYNAESKSKSGKTSKTCHAAGKSLQKRSDKTKGSWGGKRLAKGCKDHGKDRKGKK